LEINNNENYKYTFLLLNKQYIKKEINEEIKKKPRKKISQMKKTKNKNKPVGTKKRLQERSK
jgi:hypothetical protein